MGVAAVKWRCPACNIDVGGSMGELKNHMKKIHNPVQLKTETRVAATA
jgi:hypothetical protein